jgi:hypothetical protein
MHEPPAASNARFTDDAVIQGNPELDVADALESLEEAIDVAFLAIRSAQHAARSLPDTGSATRFRNEWRASNVLVRQALRLTNERVQDLTKAVKRLPRVG